MEQKNMALVRILIADDNSIIRNLVRVLLESQHGWIVCGEAVDGEDVIQKTVELRPDLVLLDTSMPKLDGWQACKLIRAKVPETKILLVTQHDPEVLRRAVVGSGACGFVVKSQISSDLKAAVAAATKPSGNN